MEFRSQRKLRRRKLKDRKFTFCDFTAFFGSPQNSGCERFRTWSLFISYEKFSEKQIVVKDFCIKV